MNRLLIVSNRLPVNISKRNGEYIFHPSAGGLATGVGSFYKSYESLWVGWPGVTVRKAHQEEKEKITAALNAEQCHPVFLSPYDIRNYYSGFCNNTLWPLFHYFPHYCDYDRMPWGVYKRVNQTFCDAVVDAARPGDMIWVHDYQLMLLPQMIRERLPDAKIGFFLHIPFPSFEVFRLLPWRKEILEGILGADLIGFHTYDYVRHFLSSVRRILGYEHTLGELTVGNRMLWVDMFPMGIDYARFAGAVNQPDVREEMKKIRKKHDQRKIILSFDRLDYSKGIPLRLEAFDALLEKRPEYREKISLILVAVPSRMNIGHYQALKQQVDELVGRVNGKYGTTDWLPVQYFYNFLPFKTLVALYRIADIALLTPLRDGMNLMAKEFLAAKEDGKGVLILSEMAGAAQELGEAVIVNPNNRDALVEAIEDALVMPEKEQMERNSVMQKRLKRYDVKRWAADFIDGLDNARVVQWERSEQILTPAIQERLGADYSAAGERLIVLDYDGTLVPFASKPERATPDAAVMEQLASLSSVSKNDVVIISGRDRQTLDRWFGTLDIGLVAEHGVWIKERSGEWSMPQAISGEWKSVINPILEVYADRTPGSFVEEKEHSLVWHYRKAEPGLGSLRAMELKDDLMHMTTNFNLAVLEGNMVIEVKNAVINKGSAVNRWIGKKSWDFILALGDDRTDEDIFTVVPDSAYSIKVGRAPSKARFNLLSQREVLPLLKYCTACDQKRAEPQTSGSGDALSA
jgi:trehalose 6-phosphate synthase/phosphatase